MLTPRCPAAPLPSSPAPRHSGPRAPVLRPWSGSGYLVLALVLVLVLIRLVDRWTVWPGVVTPPAAGPYSPSLPQSHDTASTAVPHAACRTHARRMPCSARSAPRRTLQRCSGTVLRPRGPRASEAPRDHGLAMARPSSLTRCHDHVPRASAAQPALPTPSCARIRVSLQSGLGAARRGVAWSGTGGMRRRRRAAAQASSEYRMSEVGVPSREGRRPRRVAKTGVAGAGERGVHGSAGLRDGTAARAAAATGVSRPRPGLGEGDDTDEQH